MATPAAAAPLPQRLLNFFAKYPPKLYSAKYTGLSIPVSRSSPKDFNNQTGQSSDGSSPRLSVAPNTLPEDPNTSHVEMTTPPPSNPVRLLPNPFLPFKRRGRWQGAPISLRRQAELVKLAKKHGVEPLLPPSRKSTAFKEQRILEKGLRVRGTGEGQKVKGHKWERTMNETVEKRIKAMEEMPEMIRLWKQVRLKPLIHLSLLTYSFAAWPWERLEEISKIGFLHTSFLMRSISENCCHPKTCTIDLADLASAVAFLLAS